MAQIKYNLGDLGGEEYSTNETVIGTWIDGKPLYRKVVIIDNPSNKMTFSIANIDEAINVRWSQVFNSSSVYFSYSSDGATNSIIHFESTSKNFVITTSGAFTGKMVAIIEYTKTTGV